MNPLSLGNPSNEGLNICEATPLHTVTRVPNAAVKIDIACHVKLRLEGLVKEK